MANYVTSFNANFAYQLYVCIFYILHARLVMSNWAWYRSYQRYNYFRKPLCVSDNFLSWNYFCYHIVDVSLSVLFSLLLMLSLVVSDCYRYFVTDFLSVISSSLLSRCLSGVWKDILDWTCVSDWFSQKIGKSQERRSVHYLDVTGY